MYTCILPIHIPRVKTSDHEWKMYTVKINSIERFRSVYTLNADVIINHVQAMNTNVHGGV